MGWKKINANCYCEGFAFSMCKAYMSYGSVASDGTVFVPSPVARVATRNIAICVLDANGDLIKVFGDKLYANPDLAKKKAKEMRDRYEKAISNTQM